MSWLGSVNSPRREREKSYRGREGKFCGTRSSKITKENMFTWTDTNPELLLEKSIPCFAKKLKKKNQCLRMKIHYTVTQKQSPQAFSFYSLLVLEMHYSEEKEQWRKPTEMMCVSTWKCRRNSSFVHTSARITPAVISSVCMIKTKARV